MSVPPSIARKRPPRWWRLLRVPLVAYLLLCLMMMWLENSLIFFPAKYPAGDWDAAGLPIEDANFTAADGTALHGWFWPVESPEAAVLVCHGNAGNVTHRRDLLTELPRHCRVSVLVFDYRGYGKSDGAPNEAGILSDARAARAWLSRRAGIRERDIVLLGESIGAAVAVDLAAEDGARALVLENAFTSLPDTGAYHYPWLPVRHLMRSQLNSLAKVAKYQGPLLMVHGDADSVVPYSQGQRLFAAANEPKKFLTQRGADHNDPRDESFYEAFRELMDSLASARNPADRSSSPE